MLKRILIIICLFMLAGTLPGFAQQQVYRMSRLEITPFVGYQFGGKIRVRQGDLRFNDAMAFGFALDVAVRPGAQVEFMYSRQPTVMRLKDILTGITREMFDIALEYYHIGGLYEINRTDRVKVFGVSTLGLTNFAPQDAKYSSEWRFSFSVGGGLKFFPTDRVGLRLEGRLHFPLISGGSGFWCSAPGGCSVTVGGEAMVQAVIQGGLIFAF